MTRQPWMVVLSACLFASGCLHVFRESGSSENGVGQGGAREGLEESRNPGVKSNYHVRVSGLEERKPGLEPVERVGLEIKPVESPSPPRPPDPVPVTPPPAPAPAPVATPPAPDAPVIAALRSILEKHPERAHDLLQQYDKSDREMLAILLMMAARLGEGNLDRASPQEMAYLLEQVNTLARALRPRAALLLDKMCFCGKIDSFGQFAPLPPNPCFHAGMNGGPGERIQVYAEVRNFACRHHGPFYETSLGSTLEILDYEKKVVVTMHLAAERDRRLTPRQDNFINFRFHVPPSLPQGHYTLRVTVQDQVGLALGGSREARTAQCSLDFRVVAADGLPPSTARRDRVAER